MTQENKGPAIDEVAAHYEQLAATYNDGANPHCNRAYAALIQAKLRGCHRVLELGAGSFSQSAALVGASAVLCDLSAAMLRQAQYNLPCLQADAQCLPFPNAVFDGILSVNLLEHVPDPACLFAEAARVLAPGGRAVFITPNGDQRRLLEMLEALRLKLPEGPHRFLGRAELRQLADEAGLQCCKHDVFLAFPAIHERITRLADHLCRPMGFGLFQYIVLER